MADNGGNPNNGADNKPKQKERNWSNGLLWASIVPVGLGALLFAGLVYSVDFTKVDTQWGVVGILSALVAIALIAAAGLRLILDRLARAGTRPEAPAPDPYRDARDRIAPFVLALGGAAILVLTLALVIVFALLAQIGNGSPPNTGLSELPTKIDTILLGIFGAVLPIVATWVGTVIAFYFTNESYREAARNAQIATGGLVLKPTVAERMVLYEKIAKIPVPRRGDALVKGMPEIVELMKEPVTRVIIFEEATRNPIFIIRKSRLPSDWFDKDAKKWNLDGKTVSDYRSSNNNDGDSISFEFVAVGETLERAHQIMKDSNVSDIFVTARGQKTEAVLGWLTDDLLKGT